MAKAKTEGGQPSAKWVLAKIGDIKRNPKNPRTIKDHKFKQLVKSIMEFPEMLRLRPIVVNAQMMVLGGNMRLSACIEAGLKEVPVIVADELTEAQQQEFIIKDNVSFGEWDWAAIGEGWGVEVVGEWGLERGAWETPQTTNAKAQEDSFVVPEGGIKTDIVIGDLFEIGDHRLLCGDSTDAEHVAKLMNGQKAELLFTSPPYSDMREYNGSKDLSVSNLVKFIPTFMPFTNFQVVNLGLKRKDGEVVQYWDEYIDAAKSCGLKLLSWNVWDKTIGGSIASATAMFMLTHEWIFVFGVSEKMLNRTIPNKIEEYENRHGKDWQKGKTSKVRQRDGTVSTTTSSTHTHHQLHSCLQQTPELGIVRKLHPATFPIGLCSEYIKAMLDQDGIVAEPFCGSGTTMVSAQQLSRKCYGMELDPKYCQVIINRMLALDPSLEITKNGVPYGKD